MGKAKPDWFKMLAEKVQAPRTPAPITMADRIRTDAFCERWAAAMEAKAREDDHNIAIMMAHLAANKGQLDMPSLERMLRPGPSAARH